MEALLGPQLTNAKGQFTPRLAEAYSRGLHAGKGLEVVFVSSDRSQEEFDEYLRKGAADAAMPWLALPFADRSRKAELSKRFKVQGIPTLVLLDTATGKVITSDARSRVMEDPDGAEYPWRPRSVLDLLPAQLVRAGGAVVSKHDALGAPDTVLGLYFSAHWCPPCRQFTPQLAQTYKKVREAGKHFEVVFVSSDRDAASFEEYLGEMPWAAIPFQALRGVKEKLSERFEVQGIPTLVLLDPATDKVISASGRAAISMDPEGADFPWKPKPANALTGATAGALEEGPGVIAFLDGLRAAEREPARAALREVATERLAALAAAGDADSGDSLAFFYAEDDPLVERVKQIVGGRVMSGQSVLVMVNLPARVVFESPLADARQVDAAAVRRFVADVESGKLQAQALNI